jgi:selenocysteine-specific elongation factor
LLEVVGLEVREWLAGTFLDDAPIVPVSARTGAGLDELRAALDGLFDRVEPRTSEGLIRLPVDRSFVLHGFGTVVTGTLVSGRLSEGDEVEVLPGGRRARVRGLQVHHQPVRHVEAGRRTAVNLQGLDCSEVPRGSTVTRPGSLSMTRRVWARVRWLPDAPDAARRGGPSRFHQGTCERAARLRVLECDSDGVARAEIFLNEPAVLVPGDRFILRRPSPVNTIGGGTVVDVNPPRARSAAEPAFDPAALETERALKLRLERAGPAGREPAGFGQELGLPVGQLEESALALEESGALVRAGGRWFDGDTWRDLEERALRGLSAFHEAEPLRGGMPREDLRSRTERKVPREAWRYLLERLAEGGQVVLTGESVSLRGHRVVLEGDEKALAQRIEGAYRSAGLDPPDPAQVLAGEDPARAGRIVDHLVATGALARLHDGKLFHSSAIADLLARLKDYATRSTEIDVPAFKELAGVTRKHAIPLLEHLDSLRVTRREGNRRRILVK